jgi:hypothetical protein
MEGRYVQKQSSLRLRRQILNYIVKNANVKRASSLYENAFIVRRNDSVR